MKQFILFGAAVVLFASCTSKTETHSSTSTTSTTVTKPDGTTETVSSSISTVDANTFKTQMETEPGILLDVRTPGEVAAGHLAGMVNIDFNAADFNAKINELDKSKTVYVYCKSGGRSAGAAEELKANGFTKVVNLDGGITSWEGSGLEIVK
jgi:rhodanese-related sulfurtransferase